MSNNPEARIDIPIVRELESDEELKNNLRGLKICRIATVPYFMVSQLKSQAEYLENLGMQVTLVSSAGQEWSQIHTDNGLRIRVINIPRALSPLQDFIALLRLTLFFLKHRFEIVHSTTPKAGLLSALAAYISGVPIRLHTFTGQSWIMLKGIMRWAGRFADKVIGLLNTKCYADSWSQADFLITEGIIPAEKLSVIGHGSLAGVDMERFNPDRWPVSQKQAFRNSLGIGSSSKIIIFVGRISPDKGITELVTAFFELLRMNYDVNLLLVGPHDKDCGGVDSLGLNEIEQYSRIHYTGYTECPEKYLAIADIFCLPSYREGFGTVVIEAAAMGLPTVGTAIYGLTDAVVDEITGLLVPPRDVTALVKALKHLLDHPDELDRMGRAARARCFQYFNAEIVNRKVAQEYLSLLRLKGRISGL